MYKEELKTTQDKMKKSISVLKTLDEIRRQWGLKYPSDIV